MFPFVWYVVYVLPGTHWPLTCHHSLPAPWGVHPSPKVLARRSRRLRNFRLPPSAFWILTPVFPFPPAGYAMLGNYFLKDGTKIIRTIFKVRQALRRTRHHQSIPCGAVMQWVWVVFVSQVSTVCGVLVDTISISSPGFDGGSLGSHRTISLRGIVGVCNSFYAPGNS